MISVWRKSLSTRPGGGATAQRSTARSSFCTHHHLPQSHRRYLSHFCQWTHILSPWWWWYTIIGEFFFTFVVCQESRQHHHVQKLVFGEGRGVRSRTDRGSGILEMRVSSLALSSFILHQVGRGNTNQFTLCSMVVKRGCTGGGVVINQQRNGSFFFRRP